jgi:hypothetical protein
MALRDRPRRWGRWEPYIATNYVYLGTYSKYYGYSTLSCASGVAGRGGWH